MTQPTCETCRFWEPCESSVSDLSGACHRFPPTLNQLQLKRALKVCDWNEHTEEEITTGEIIPCLFAQRYFECWQQPFTEKGDWCGEHEPVPNEHAAIRDLNQAIIGAAQLLLGNGYQIVWPHEPGNP